MTTHDSLAIEPEQVDAPAAQRLLRAYAAELDAVLGGLDERRSLSVLGAPDAEVAGHAGADELAPPHGTFLVAYEDDRPVGCAGLKTLETGLGEVKRMYVEPEARGRGYARQLLTAIEDHARSLGHRRLRLDTAANMPEARALYESAGYQAIPDYNANMYAAYWYEKKFGD